MKSHKTCRKESKMRNSNLAKFRAEKELSTMDIAKIIGVSTSFYEKIEYGQRKPSYNFIVKFKNAFPESDISIFFAK
jgi:putative transcriptional regulator